MVGLPATVVVGNAAAPEPMMPDPNANARAVPLSLIRNNNLCPSVGAPVIVTDVIGADKAVMLY